MEEVAGRFNPQSKLLKHKYELCQFLNQRIVFPILVEISPTNKCNAKCSFCFYAGRHTKEEIEHSELRETLKDFWVCGVKAVNWTGGGEPTIYRHFKDVTELANGLGLRQGLFTNAYDPSQVDPKLFDWIRISLTPRYFLFQKTLIEWSEHTVVGVCMSVTNDNIRFAKLMCQLSSRYGADYFQVRPALAPPGSKQEKIDQERLQDLKQYETESFKVELSPYKFQDYLEPRQYDICYGCNFCPSLIYNGDLCVCNYHFEEPEFTLGNVYKMPFGQIWTSISTKDCLNSLQGKKLDNCQICCKNHEINKLLYFMKHGEVKNKHFI